MNSAAGTGVGDEGTVTWIWTCPLIASLTTMLAVPGFTAVIASAVPVTVTAAIALSDVLAVYGAAPPAITKLRTTVIAWFSAEGAVVNKAVVAPTETSRVKGAPKLSFSTTLVCPPATPVMTNRLPLMPTPATATLLLAMLYGGRPPLTLYSWVVWLTPTVNIAGAVVNSKPTLDETVVVINTSAPAESFTDTEAVPLTTPVILKVLSVCATVTSAALDVTTEYGALPPLMAYRSELAPARSVKVLGAVLNSAAELESTVTPTFSCAPAESVTVTTATPSAPPVSTKMLLFPPELETVTTEEFDVTVVYGALPPLIV